MKVLSGVFAYTSRRDATTGTTIALLIENVGERSKDYAAIRDKYRPGHADYTYDIKYGVRRRSCSRRRAARSRRSDLRQAR